MGPRARQGLELGGLLLVLAFVASVAYLPHADSSSNPPGEGPAPWLLAKAYGRWLLLHETDDYEHPMHVDEHVHWVAVESMQRADSIRHNGIFFATPEGEAPLSLRGLVHERGFHVALVMMQELTGIPWHEAFRFLPALWLTVTASLLWAALRPWRGALPAAALVALVPTSARFLGPGFLVPIGFGLAWVAATLLLAQHARNGRTAGLLLLVVMWAFFIHLIAGFAALLLVVCTLPFLGTERRNLAWLGAATLAPILWLFQAFEADIQGEFTKLATLPIDLTLFDQLGLPFLGAWALGCALMVLRPPRAGGAAVRAATLASAVGLALIAINLVANLRLYALYDRWHPIFALLAVVPVAHAVLVAADAAEWAARRALASRPRLASRGAPAAPAIAALVVLVGIAEPGLAGHLREPFYHVLSDDEWAAFQWAAANVNQTYEVFVTEPWQAPVFSAMTGKEPLTYLIPGIPPVRGDDYRAYLGGRYGDGAWLIDRDVSLVLDPTAPTVPEFETTGPMTSQLEWVFARDLASLRAS